jgi:hypothetical protein
LRAPGQTTDEERELALAEALQQEMIGGVYLPRIGATQLLIVRNWDELIRAYIKAYRQAARSAAA